MRFFSLGAIVAILTSLARANLTPAPHQRGLSLTTDICASISITIPLFADIKLLGIEILMANIVIFDRTCLCISASTMTQSTKLLLDEKLSVSVGANILLTGSGMNVPQGHSLRLMTHADLYEHVRLSILDQVSFLRPFSSGKITHTASCIRLPLNANIHAALSPISAADVGTAAPQAAGACTLQVLNKGQEKTARVFLEFEPSLVSLGNVSSTDACGVGRQDQTEALASPTTVPFWSR
ncbi:hypothetical protein M231_03846 [Tremella mesenterica]|uniref:Uncharacterized protein n=1 Tax=Tremella mesenterica TaxID=5217 RepID=A0A4V1M426_TREME|nr:hypothetical protein M231_03846 [Tremella mesenterica]